jgi:predicted esterase
VLTPSSRFDVYGFGIFTRAEDEQSLLSAVSRLDALITAEIDDHGIPPERIVVGGLSQGGTLACLTALTTRKNLAGLFVLSAYVPLCRKTKEVSRVPVCQSPPP